MKNATCIESQNAITHLMSIEILHFVHLVFTSREKIPFDIRHSCVKTEDGWFVQQLNRCFYSAYYVTVSGLGSGGGAGSCGR